MQFEIMKIINYESYVVRTTKPLENLAGCGIKEVGIKATIKLLCFIFKIKILKIKCNENCEKHLTYFEEGHIHYDNGKLGTINTASIAYLLNNLNNKIIN